jgi:hypothetical protein
MRIIFYWDFDESISHSDMSVIAGIVPDGVSVCRKIQCRRPAGWPNPVARWRVPDVAWQGGRPKR